MIDKALALLSPHICKACRAPGETLCNSCFFDITEDNFGRCIVCDVVTSRDCLCRACSAKTPISRAFVVGEREGVLRRLVGDFKYNSERASAEVLGRLFDAILPDLPLSTVVIPIPTIAPHIRQRGFDHMLLVAQRLSKMRGWRCDNRLLRRADNSVQHGLSASKRRVQAAKAFEINPHRPAPREVLLIDDIFTTGATTMAAARFLKKAGVEVVNLGIIARQTKD